MKHIKKGEELVFKKWDKSCSVCGRTKFTGVAWFTDPDGTVTCSLCYGPFKSKNGLLKFLDKE